jgi:hypothetical protein
VFHLPLCNFATPSSSSLNIARQHTQIHYRVAYFLLSRRGIPCSVARCLSSFSFFHSFLFSFTSLFLEVLCVELARPASTTKSHFRHISVFYTFSVDRRLRPPQATALFSPSRAALLSPPSFSFLSTYIQISYLPKF